MKSIKIFLDHFYFSLVSVAIGLVVLYLVVSGLGANFSVSDYKLATGCAWLGLSSALAALLTCRTIRSRKRPHIFYTRRQT